MINGYTLTPEEMESNYNELIRTIQNAFPTRATQLVAMYEGIPEVAMAPASSIEHFHNAFPGGYIDHVLRVLKMAFAVYENWKLCGLDVSTFTVEELAFSAMHHDLGKVGFPGTGNERYLYNTSEWHRKNQGKIYNVNGDIPFALVPDLSLFLLQKYGVPMSWNEYHSIRIHDGAYESINDPYYKSFSDKAALRSNLPLILHHADMMASRFEYERWLSTTGNKNKNYRG